MRQLTGILFFTLLQVFTTQATSVTTGSGFTFVEMKVKSDNQLHFTTRSENGGQYFVIEQFVYNRWMTIAEKPGHGGMDTAMYAIDLHYDLHSGINTFRIRHYGRRGISQYSDNITCISNIKKVYAFRRSDRILLSRRLRWLVIDGNGMIMRRGYGSVIQMADLPQSSKLFLCYDNQVFEINRRFSPFR